MARKALKPCAQPGCSALTAATYCDKHRRADGGRRDAEWRSWYHGGRYRAARDAFMAEHPLCALCGAPSSDLDHKKPHKGDLRLFWDTDNWQALCAGCHSRKTAEEDGGFGNRRGRW